MPGKLGRTSEQRLAILRNQASSLLWYGKIETTKARAKELRSYVEKIITAAVNTYDDTVESTKAVSYTHLKEGAYATLKMPALPTETISCSTLPT